MFAEAEEAQTAAREARANLLAPDSFEEAQAAFDSAACTVTVTVALSLPPLPSETV